LTVDELSEAFLSYGREYYGDRPHSTIYWCGHALDYLRALYGPTATEWFDSLALLAVQTSMIESGLSRTTGSCAGSGLVFSFW
jgi:hypothetical protein